MLKTIFKKKISKKRLALATEHEAVQRGQAEALARGKMLLKRLDEKKRTTKSE